MTYYCKCFISKCFLSNIVQAMSQARVMASDRVTCILPKQMQAIRIHLKLNQRQSTKKLRYKEYIVW